jgi:hypothetical protein
MLHFVTEHGTFRNKSWTSSLTVLVEDHHTSQPLSQADVPALVFSMCHFTGIASFHCECHCCTSYTPTRAKGTVSFRDLFTFPNVLWCGVLQSGHLCHCSITATAPCPLHKPEACWNLLLLQASYISWRMPSPGMLHRVALVRTDVSVDRSASIIRVTGISE